MIPVFVAQEKLDLMLKGLNKIREQVEVISRLTQAI
jgi:hypothetical protein